MSGIVDGATTASSDRAISTPAPDSNFDPPLPASAPEASRHLPFLDILRALAILLVMSWHLPDAVEPAGFSVFRELGWLGVDIFFVLSGFLIASQTLYQTRQGKPFRIADFYVKRAFRILPVYLLILAVYFFLPSLREAPDIGAAWRYLTFTINFGLDYRVTNAFTQAWSLCVEEHFYMLFPLLFALMARAKTAGPAIGLALFFIIAGMLLRYVSWGVWTENGQVRAEYFTLLYYPTYTRLDGLVAGVLLAAARVYYPDMFKAFGRSLPCALIAVIGIGYTVFCALTYGPAMPLLGSLLAYPAFACGIAATICMALATRVDLAGFATPVFGFVAMVSYSLYLSHKLTYHGVQLLLPEALLAGWPGVAIYYLASIAVAAILYRLIEAPSLTLRKHLQP
jgi:peptidoglycan/LPS O-acetylase OafA/YrhL